MLWNVKGLKGKKKPPEAGGGFRGFSALLRSNLSTAGEA
jgi:hypothetical protein